MRLMSCAISAWKAKVSTSVSSSIATSCCCSGSDAILTLGEKKTVIIIIFKISSHVAFNKHSASAQVPSLVRREFRRESAAQIQPCQKQKDHRVFQNPDHEVRCELLYTWWYDFQNIRRTCAICSALSCAAPHVPAGRMQIPGSERRYFRTPWARLGLGLGWSPACSDIRT